MDWGLGRSGVNATWEAGENAAELYFGKSSS